MSFTEQLIFDAQQLLTIDSKVATSRKAHRLTASCAIKRLRNWSTPIDYDRLAMLVGNSKPADVKTFDLAFGLTESINATKYECCVTQI